MGVLPIIEPTIVVARSPQLVTGVRNPQRLRAVADAELHGHLGDSNLDAIVETLRIACAVPIAAVNVVSPNLQTYPAEVGVGLPCSDVPDPISFCTAVVDTGSELIVADARAHPVYVENPLVRSGHIGSYAGVPLVDNDIVLGAVSILDVAPRHFTDNELTVLRRQARLASNVLALRRTARTDILTGLPNRALCLDSLSRTLSRLDRHGGGVAVMFVDVDGFKAVNDGLGHHVGDQLLVELGRRMTAVLRPADTLARFGGDEFVVICEDIETPVEAGEVAARLLSAIGSSVSIDGKDVQFAVSIGVTVTTTATERAESLLRGADHAMYHAKQQGGGQWWLAAHHGPEQSRANR